MSCDPRPVRAPHSPSGHGSVLQGSTQACSYIDEPDGAPADDHSGILRLSFYLALSSGLHGSHPGDGHLFQGVFRAGAAAKHAGDAMKCCVVDGVDLGLAHPLGPRQLSSFESSLL